MPVQTRGDRSSSSESSGSVKMSEEGSSKVSPTLTEIEGRQSSPLPSTNQSTEWSIVNRDKMENNSNSPILQKRRRRRKKNNNNNSSTHMKNHHSNSHNNTTQSSRSVYSRHWSSKKAGSSSPDHSVPAGWAQELDDWIGSLSDRIWKLYYRIINVIHLIKSSVTLPNITTGLLNIVCLNCVFIPCLIFSFVTLPLSMLSSRVILGSFVWSLQRNYLMWKAIYQVLGLTGLVLVSPIIYVYQSLTLFSLMVDLILFPGIRSVKVTRPVFVTGCARSGTTYCHRVLTANPKSSNKIAKKNKRNNDDGGSFAIWRLWEILFPSVTIRYIIFPFVNCVDKFLALFDAYALLDGAYDYRLNGDAHEEAILSLHAMCGDFWVECHPIGFFWKSQIEWIGLNTPSDNHGSETNTNNHNNNSHDSKKNRRRGGSALVEARDETFWKLHTSFLKQMLQRQIYFTGNKQVVAKSPSLTWCLPQLVEEFPDCKIVLLARNPNDMLKSNFALMNRSWTLMYGDKRVSEIYNGAMKNLIWRRHEQWRRTLEFLKCENKRNQQQSDDSDNEKNGDQNEGHEQPTMERRVLVIRYDDLKFNIRAVVEKVFEHCGLELSMELRRWSQTEEHRQRTRKRSHSVKSFAHYKIPVRPVRDAFKEVCEYFLFTQEWK